MGAGNGNRSRVTSNENPDLKTTRPRKGVTGYRVTGQGSRRSTGENAESLRKYLLARQQRKGMLNPPAADPDYTRRLTSGEIWRAARVKGHLTLINCTDYDI